MNRITKTLENASGRKLLVPFFTVGYPDYTTSLELIKVAFDSGADMVELGMPFSDPLADGPDIQFSSGVAIDNGINLSRIREAVLSIRSSIDSPLIAMGYYNPILTYGLEPFLSDFAAAGLDGLIIPDLPVDEASQYTRRLKANAVSAIFLVAPTSDAPRIRQVDRHCSDFVYAVTVTGVTGAGRSFGKETTAYLQRLKKSLSHPFVAGFGVSSAENARALCEVADGVVIGSALIRIVRNARNHREGVKSVGRLLGSIRKALS